MKIAQVVITKDKQDQWVVKKMSLQQTDQVDHHETVAMALAEVEIFMKLWDWETLSL